MKFRMKNLLLSLFFISSFYILMLVGNMANSQTVGVQNDVRQVRFGNVGIGTFTANPGTYATIYTAPTNGALLKSVIASNFDTTTDHVVTCRICNASNVCGLQTALNAPHQTGQIAPVSILGTVPGLWNEQWQNAAHYLPVNYYLQCTYTTALSNGWVAVDAQAGEY